MAARLTAYVVVAIVAATLIAGLIVGAQRDDNDGPVDLIVTNATVYTADRRGTTAEAVAVRGNQILRVGTAREIARLQLPQTIVVDARGGVVLPGFNDAHVDMIAGGLELAVADLSDAATAEEALDRVRTWSEANPQAPWVIGKGWTPAAVPQRSADPAHARRRRQGPAGALLRFGRERSVGVGELAGAEARRHHPDYAGSARGHRARGPERRTLRGAAWNRRRGPRGAGAQALARRTGSRRCAGPSPKRIRGASPAPRTRPPTARRTSNCSTASAARGEMTLRIYCVAAAVPSAIRAESDLAHYNELRVKYPGRPVLQDWRAGVQSRRNAATP